MAATPSPSVTDLLVGTYDRLTNPAAWSRRAGARTATGDRCDACSPAATSWCLWGAIERQLGTVAHAPDRVALAEQIEDHLLHTLRSEAIFGLVELDSLQQFNDDRSTTHEDVLELLDMAVLMLQPRATVSLSLNACRA